MDADRLLMGVVVKTRDANKPDQANKVIVISMMVRMSR